MKEINLTFDVDPKPKGRPRFGGNTYTPASTRRFENLLKTLTKQQYRSAPIQEHVAVKIRFYFKIPKRPKYPFPTIGDIDNYSKAILDALNGIVWKDDSRIADLDVKKRFAEKSQILVSVTLAELQTNAVDHSE